jgi:hypothetical protein
VEDEMLEWFLWTVGDEFLVAGGQRLGELGILCLIH